MLDGWEEFNREAEPTPDLRGARSPPLLPDRKGLHRFFLSWTQANPSPAPRTNLLIQTSYGLKPRGEGRARAARTAPESQLPPKHRL